MKRSSLSIIQARQAGLVKVRGQKFEVFGTPDFKPLTSDFAFRLSPAFHASRFTSHEQRR